MPNNYVVNSELDAPEEVWEKLSTAGEIACCERVYQV